MAITRGEKKEEKNMDKNELDWHEQMYTNLRKVARKHGFMVAVTQNRGGDFADFIININERDMMGLKLKPALSVKPFSIFPYDKDMGLDELDKFLEGYALARETSYKKGREKAQAKRSAKKTNS